MNNEKLYQSIIEKAQKENREKGKGVYYERHHITPKFIGGSNEKDNLVLLTAREHFVCHLLLTKFVPDEYLGKAWNAVYQFGASSKNQKRYISSRFYEIAKKRFIEDHVKRHTGSKRKKETVEKMREAAKRRWQKEKEQGIVRNYSNSKGPKNHTQTQEHKDKKSKKLSKKIVVYGVVYESRKRALELSGYTYQQIRTALYGENKEVYYL